MTRGPSGASSGTSSSAILTIPNALSFARILLIPLFFWLIVHRGTEAAGLLLLGFVSSTDWVDGYVARRMGSVSELGKILDPTADRLVIAAGLVAVVVRGVFPLWAALLILVRDGLVLLAGAVVLALRSVRLDVRWIGKVATLELMAGVPFVAWGRLGLLLAPASLAIGWGFFCVGIVEYYVAAAMYVGDLRRALAATPD